MNPLWASKGDSSWWSCQPTELAPSSAHAGAPAQETDGANSQLHTIYLFKAADAGHWKRGVIYELERENERGKRKTG